MNVLLIKWGIKKADTLEYVEGQAKTAASGQAAGGSGGGLKARHAWQGKRQRNLGDPSQSWSRPSMPTEWTIHRAVNAAVEVGSPDSILRAKAKAAYMVKQGSRTRCFSGDTSLAPRGQGTMSTQLLKIAQRIQLSFPKRPVN